MSKYVFKGNVLHDKLVFKKGQECPKELFDEMHKKGLVDALPEAVHVDPAKPAKPAEPAEPAKK